MRTRPKEPQTLQQVAARNCGNPGGGSAALSGGRGRRRCNAIDQALRCERNRKRSKLECKRLFSSVILELAYDSDGSALGGRIHMVAIAFSAMVILGLVSIVMHWTMRIRLMRLDSTRDRIEWLSFRGGDDVLNTYEALFPRSVLPRFCRFVFWSAIVVAAVGLCAIIILRVSGR